MQEVAERRGTGTEQHERASQLGDCGLKLCVCVCGNKHRGYTDLPHNSENSIYNIHVVLETIHVHVCIHCMCIFLLHVHHVHVLTVLQKQLQK